jgi:hypothetical protein
MSSSTRGREFVPAESSIIRIAQAIRDSELGLWDFGQEYAVLNAIPGFNYQALGRAVKDQHGVDLYPPHIATKLRRSYETFVMRCKVPFERVRKFSPYYLYEVSCMTEITPDNANTWLDRIRVTARADLLEQIRANNPGSHEAMTTMRVPENVHQALVEATQHLGVSISNRELSLTAFLEFVAELVKNTDGMQLRRLWDLAHGSEPGA